MRITALQQEVSRLRIALAKAQSNSTPGQGPASSPRSRALDAPQTDSSRSAELLLSPTQVISYAARALFFPARESANPVRRAWAAAGLDWHNLVRPVTGVPKSSGSGSGSGATAEAALYRDRREVVKAQLLDLLLGYSRVGPSPAELARRAVGALAIADDGRSAACPANGSASASSAVTLVAGDTTALPLHWLGGERGALAAALIDEIASLALRGTGGGTSDDPAVSLPPSLLSGLTALLAEPSHAPGAAAYLGEAFRRRVESPWAVTAAVAYGAHPLPDAGSTDGGAAADALTDLRSPSSDPGPLAKFAACPVVADRCLVHGGSARECVEDELCGWCERPRGADAIVTGAMGPPAADAAKGGRGSGGAASGGICVSRWMPLWPEAEGGGGKAARAAPVCEGPLHVVAESVPEWHGSQWGAQAAAESGGQEGGKPSAAPPPPLHALSPDGSLSPQPVARESCALAVTRSAPAAFSLDGTSKMAYHFYTVRACVLGGRCCVVWCGVTQRLQSPSLPRPTAGDGRRLGLRGSPRRRPRLAARARLGATALAARVSRLAAPLLKRLPPQPRRAGDGGDAERRRQRRQRDRSSERIRVVDGGGRGGVAAAVAAATSRLLLCTGGTQSGAQGGSVSGGGDSRGGRQGGGTGGRCSSPPRPRPP